jgi:Zn finger protein HypA/HybF involved in hydrogenase expression
MQTTTQAWIDAGARLTRDPQARVLCPECREAPLDVSDIMGARALERLMTCPKCGARNFALMSGVRSG